MYCVSKPQFCFQRGVQQMSIGQQRAERSPYHHDCLQWPTIFFDPSSQEKLVKKLSFSIRTFICFSCLTTAGTMIIYLFFIHFNNKMLGQRNTEHRKSRLEAGKRTFYHKQMINLGNECDYGKKSPIKDLQNDENYWSASHDYQLQNKSLQCRQYPLKVSNNAQQFTMRQRQFSMKLNNIDQLNDNIHGLLECVKNPNRKSIFRHLRDNSMNQMEVRRAKSSFPKKQPLLQKKQIPINEQKKQPGFKQKMQESDQDDSLQIAAIKKYYAEKKKLKINTPLQPTKQPISNHNQEIFSTKINEKPFYDLKYRKFQQQRQKNIPGNKKKHAKEIDEEILKVKAMLNNVQKNMNVLDRQKQLRSYQSKQKSLKKLHRDTSQRNLDKSPYRAKKNYLQMLQRKQEQIQEDSLQHYSQKKQKEMNLKKYEDHKKIIKMEDRQKMIKLEDRQKMIKVSQTHVENLRKSIVKPSNSGRIQAVCRKIANSISQQINLDKKLRSAKQMFANIPGKQKWTNLRDILKRRGFSYSQKQLERELTNHDNQCDPFEDQSQYRRDSIDILAQAFIDSQNFWEYQLKKTCSAQELQHSGFDARSLDLDQRGYLIVEDLVCFINLYTQNFYRNRDIFCLMRRIMALERNRNGISYDNFIKVISN